MKKASIEKIISQFIHALNEFDVHTALALFADDAVIDDVSVGEKFKNTMGVRQYLEQFFVNYKTETRLESLEIHNDLHATARVDFTGDFGHETGALEVTLNQNGLIIAINAYLD